MSTYSATPAPPARIRIVSHPPLPRLRAWLPLPTFSPLTNEPALIRDLARTVRGMLGTEGEVELELEGFALFDTSPLSILDPANDVLDIKLAQATQLGSAEAAPAPRPVLPPVHPTTVPLPASSAISASSSSSSSPSSSSRSDSEPEALPSKRPLSTLNESKNGASPRPTKRRRREASTASSTSSSSSSTSSSDSSDSSSSSSSSSSGSDSGTVSPHPALPTPSTARNGPLVPPGSGSKRTHKRNLRKKTLRIAKAREAEQSRTARIEPNKIEADAHHQEVDKPVGAESKTTLAHLSPPRATATRPPPTRSSSSNVRANPTGKAPTDPYADYAGPSTIPSLAQSILPPAALRNGSEPGVSHVGPGRGNLHLHASHDLTQNDATGSSSSLNATAKGKKQKQKKRQEQQQQRATPPPPSSSSRTNPRASPTYTPASPNYTPSVPFDVVEERDSSLLPTTTTTTTIQPPPPPPQQQQQEPPSQQQYPPRFLFPNQRRDLAPWLVVTSVNVEKPGWEPGVGKRFRGTSKEWIETEQDSGSRDGVKGSGIGDELLEEEVEEKDKSGEYESNEVREGEGKGEWVTRSRTREEVERDWEGFEVLDKEVGPRRIGSLVALKVLELDPTTFNPTLALKYGRLVASKNPAGAALRIELHPSCLSQYAQGDDDDEYYEEEGGGDEEGGDEEEEYGYKAKMKFGQDALEVEEAGREEGFWEGDWQEGVRLVR